LAEHYSPLRYPGGKARLARFLAAILHRNGHVRSEYVEPYAGGAGIALQLLFEEYVDRVVINDADPRMHSFWWAVTRRTREFIELVRATPVTVDAWHQQREIYATCDPETPLRLGFATFFLNRTTRSGIIHNGGPIGGYDQTGNYKIDARYNSKALVRRIVRIGAHADRIETKGEDGQDLLKFTGSGLQWSDLSVSNNGKGHAVVRVEGADSRIVLEGVDASLIGQDDFIF